MFIKPIRVWLTLATLVLGSMAACGGDDDDSSGAAGSSASGGGSCTSATSCYMVTDPPNHDIKTICQALGSTWSASECPKTGYARKCTQVTKESVNGGASTDVTYVYYFSASDPDRKSVV